MGCILINNYGFIFHTVPFTAPVIHSARANATAINITQSIPSGSVVAGFFVHWQRDGSFGCPKTYEGYSFANNISNITVTGLQEDSRYNITVRAINDVGRGPASNTITVTTREAGQSKSPLFVPTMMFVNSPQLLLVHPWDSGDIQSHQTVSLSSGEK